MAYTNEYQKTLWANGQTALSADNMNNIEQGIYDAHEALEDVYTKSESIIAAHPVGSMLITRTNTNPSASLGGNWTLRKKVVGYRWLDLSSDTTWGPFVHPTSAHACLNGDTVELRLIWTNEPPTEIIRTAYGIYPKPYNTPATFPSEAARTAFINEYMKYRLSDTTTEICTIDLSAIGLPSSAHTFYGVAISDALNAVGLLQTTFPETGKMKISAYDWVTRSESYPTALGETCNASLLFNMQSATSVNDSLCDEFHWERTS